MVLSAEEEKRFVHEAMLRNSKTGKFVYAAGLYSLLLLYTGMRCGEMLAAVDGGVQQVVQLPMGSQLFGA